MNRRHLLATAVASAAALTLAARPAAATPPAFAGAGLDHVAINVRDFDRMHAWYRDHLGFGTDVAWRVGALDGKRLAYMTSGTARIELVEADADGPGLPAPQDFRAAFARVGYAHVCFLVDDVDAVLAGLREEGVETFVHAETYDLEGTSHRRRVGFVLDPEGNVLEFGEPLLTVG